MVPESEKGLRMSQEHCPPCGDFLDGPEPAACTRFQDYLTPEEEEVLAMLREIKERARLVRGKIRGIEMAMAMAGQSDGCATGQGDDRVLSAGHGSMHEEMAACLGEMEALRGAWREWTARREAENERKLVLLGHRPWPGGAR
jgi:hypothetical protein